MVNLVSKVQFKNLNLKWASVTIICGFVPYEYYFKYKWNLSLLYVIENKQTQNLPPPTKCVLCSILHASLFFLRYKFLECLNTVPCNRFVSSI